MYFPVINRHITSRLSDIINGSLDYSTPTSWNNGEVVNIDVPNAENMTREEVEAWIIRKNLIPLVNDLNKASKSPLTQSAADTPTNPPLWNKTIRSTFSDEKFYSNDFTKEVSINMPLTEKPNATHVLPIVTRPKREGRRFKVGDHYIIYPYKNKALKREYVVKKTIYNIEDYEVRILIMKQVKGGYHTKYTLNRKDCAMFHLKYEEGLEVFSMDLDWKLLNKKEKKR